MPKRPSNKRPASKDLNVAAHQAVQALTGSTEEEQAMRTAAARILGHLGGSKGGKERARRLTAKRRSEIAKKAAQARWNGTSKDGTSEG